jgi:hypothetical protein
VHHVMAVLVVWGRMVAGLVCVHSVHCNGRCLATTCLQMTQLLSCSTSVLKCTGCCSGRWVACWDKCDMLKDTLHK